MITGWKALSLIPDDYLPAILNGRQLGRGLLFGPLAVILLAVLLLTAREAVGADVSITISGTLYSDEGITPLSGQTVRLLVDGASAGTDVTDASGNYSIVATVIGPYMPLLVYVDGGSVAGTTVSVLYSSVPVAINDLHIYADHLILRQDEGGTPLDNGDISNADGNYGDTDILYYVLGSDLTVRGANTELYVASGHSYTPGGNITTAHMQIEGTLTAGSNTFTVSGNWDHSNGTFNYDTSTVDFTGTGTISVTGAWWTKPFYNVNAAAAGQTTTILAGQGIGVANVLSLGSGTLAGGNINLSLDNGTPLVTAGAAITNSQIKFHPNNAGSINVAGTAYSEIWLAGNATTNTFTLSGDMSCTTLKVYGSGTDDRAILDTSVSNHTVTCNELIVGSSSLDRYGTLRLNNSTVNISGNVTINGPGASGANEIDAGGSTINVGGDWTNNDTFTYGTSTVNFTGTGTISLDVSNWFGIAKHFYNVTAAAAGENTTILATSGMVVENVLTLGTGVISGGKVYLNKDGGAPLVTAGATLSNLLFRYQPSAGSVDIASTNYPDLFLASKGAAITFSLLGNISCDTLLVSGNSASKKSILDTTTANYSISCNNIKIGNTTDTRYGKLVLNNSVVSVAGSVTIYPSDVGGMNEIDAGSATINVGGDWTNNDIFTQGTSSVILDGTGQQVQGDTTFYDLTKTVTSADTLTFAAGTTQTITGTATLQGTSGQLLSLRSSASPTRWNFNLANGASKAISYVDVQDSDASGSDSSLIEINPSYSTDSGNNVSWFGNANIIATKSSTVISDPVNGTANPKRIPGAVVEYTIIVTNTVGAQATNVTITDDLSVESATLAFETDGYAAGKGIQVTAPNINGGLTTNLTNASDGDQGDYGVSAVDTVTVGGMVLGAGEQAILKFRVAVQ